jgi:rhamnopyranosyl-N-acetylglucosaminyl-diphospho-decaprenol beta-1,3/1,4-galactofuranosyltransferase
MTIAAVVVTFNRKELLKQNLDALIGQTYPLDQIIVIDNHSSDGTELFLNDAGYLKKSLIKYIRLPENSGGAGGFYEGIKAAYEGGFDWIWGMDDDAIPAPNALEILIQKSSNDTQSCYWSNCDQDNVDYCDDIKIVNHWMFVGFLINKDVVQTVGFPRKDFFIYHDDFEYAKRIVRHGYLIKKVKTSLINHVCHLTPSQSRKIFKWKITAPQLADWRIYYHTRNRILAFSFCEIGKYRTYFSMIIKLAIPLLLLNPRQLRMFFKGYFHGIIGKSGKIMLPSK